MLFPSASAGRRRRVVTRFDTATRELWPYLVGVAATLFAAMGGALAAASPSLAAVGAAGIVGAISLVFASSAFALLGLLVIRNLTDATATTPIVAGLNAGAIVGLVVIGAVCALLVGRYATKTPIRGLPIAIVVTGFIVYWSGVGYLQYGVNQSLMRELVRMLSIVAVAVIAANSDRSVNGSKIGMIVVVAALIPAFLVINEALQNWQEMVGGGLRPRGTMSHPNAAAILFGIATPIAVWKATYDRSGVRYLWAAGLLCFAVLLTRSMGGLAQLVVGMLTLGMIQSGRPIYRFALVGAVVTLALFFILDPLGISRVDELQSTQFSVQAAESEETVDNNTLEWRLVNWARFLDVWQESRLMGWGLGSTDEIIAPLGHLPHSDPIRYLVETGILGVSLIAIGYFAVVNRLLLLSRVGPNASLAGATLAVVAGVCTHSLVTHVSFNTAPAYVLAALVGWVLTGRPEDHQDHRRAEATETAGAGPASRARLAEPPPALIDPTPRRH